MSLKEVKKEEQDSPQKPVGSIIFEELITKLPTDPEWNIVPDSQTSDPVSSEENKPE